MLQKAATTNPRHRAQLGAAILAAVVGLAVVAAACSSATSPPGVASLGTTTTILGTTANDGSGSLGSTNLADAEKYAQCMRASGVPNWPDPNSQGNFVIKGPELGVSPQTQQRADSHCSHLLPNDGKPTAQQMQAFLAQGLRLAQCMRAHGVTEFPDPVEHDGNIGIRIGGNGVDPRSSVFRRATSACAADFPGGQAPPSPPPRS